MVGPEGAGASVAVAEGEPLGWGTTGAARAPWEEERPASLTSLRREEEEEKVARGVWRERERKKKERNKRAKEVKGSKKENT